ncbi:MAG TPA: endonuclease/exonuclease/phosphatase family protein [Candidatus Ozemobacteraceae bacterium]|nr:endonuclease/exonuclease/phosphatase family protein [Candidatus Ozemobacteraceae bacterium]
MIRSVCSACLVIFTVTLLGIGGTVSAGELTAILNRHQVANISVSPSASPAAMKMRIATYNIAHARGNKRGGLNELGNITYLYGIGKLLKNEKVDLVGVTEISKFDLRSGLYDQAWLLARMLGFKYVIGENAREALLATSQGNAILSRYPILWSRNHKLYRESTKEEQRGCLEARLDLGRGRHLRVFVAHLSLKPAESTRQLREIWGFIKDLKEPAVLMGDFNSFPADARIKELQMRMTDISANVNTTYMNNPGVKIDYLFVHGPIKEAGDAWVRGFKEGYSDHGCLVNDVLVNP